MDMSHFMSVFLALLLVIVSPLRAQTTEGPLSPLGAVSLFGGDIAWSDPSYSLSSDDVWATVTLGKNEVSDYLVVTDFDFSIPIGATINGIYVTIEKSVAFPVVGNIKDNEVSLTKDGLTPVGQNKKSPSQWFPVDNVSVYGGNSDLWATTWSPAEVNDSTFGLCLLIKKSQSGDMTAQVDHITITVYYTEPLPVEMGEISVECEGLTHRVSWITYSESNNDHFVVECSSDGHVWSDLCTQPGSGFSSTTTEYSCTVTPSSGCRYLRIRQVDFDGHYTCSDIMSVECPNDTTLPFRFISFSGSVVRFWCGYPGEMIIEVYDTNARVVYSSTEWINSGTNEIEICDLVGVYVLVFITKDGTFVEKIVFP